MGFRHGWIQKTKPRGPHFFGDQLSFSHVWTPLKAGLPSFIAARWLLQPHCSLNSKAKGKNSSPPPKPSTSPKPASGGQEPGPRLMESGIPVAVTRGLLIAGVSWWLLGAQQAFLRPCPPLMKWIPSCQSDSSLSQSVLPPNQRGAVNRTLSQAASGSSFKLRSGWAPPRQGSAHPKLVSLCLEPVSLTSFHPSRASTPSYCDQIM